MNPSELSADIVLLDNGWCASISDHSSGGRKEVWRKEGMKTENHAEISLESAWKKITRKSNNG